MELARQAVLGSLSRIDTEKVLFAKCICICAGQSNIKHREEIDIYA
jgi:hypothetical protein